MTSITYYTLKSKNVSVTPGTPYSLDYFFDIVAKDIIVESNYVDPKLESSSTFITVADYVKDHRKYDSNNDNKNRIDIITSHIDFRKGNASAFGGPAYFESGTAEFTIFGVPPAGVESYLLKNAKITFNVNAIGLSITAEDLFLLSDDSKITYATPFNTRELQLLGSVSDKSNQTFDLSGRITITGSEIPVAISIADASPVQEGDAGAQNATFTVSLNTAAAYAVTVSYATKARTATAGTDFTPASGTLTFAPGETSKTVAVPVLGDTLPEGDEVFELVLSSPVGASGKAAPMISRGTGTATIIDDEGIVVSVSNARTLEGVGSILIPVSLSKASAQPVSVSYATSSSGAASASSDYVPTSGLLTFVPGETRKSVTVQLRDDKVVESEEAFQLVLSNPTGAVAGPPVALGQKVGTATIIDDDAAPERLTAAQIKETVPGDYLEVAGETIGVLDQILGRRTDILDSVYEFGAGLQPQAFAAAGAFSVAARGLEYGSAFYEVLNVLDAAAQSYVGQP